METATIQNSNYRIMLAEELAKRQDKNPGYSLRAFAKAIGVSVATLSEVLNGKRALSKQSTFTIMDKLFDSPEDRRQFLFSSLGIEASGSGDDFQLNMPSGAYGELDIDQFKVISDWFHLAILSLAKVKNYCDPKWIAKRLGITRREAKSAFDRLTRLNLIGEENNGFKRSTKSLFVNSRIPSSAVRSYHKQNLEKAIESLENDPFEIRDFSSITMAVSKSKMAEAKKRIQKFREEMSSFLESGDSQEVYTLAVQLFPITKNTGEE